MIAGSFGWYTDVSVRDHAVVRPVGVKSRG